MKPPRVLYRDVTVAIELRPCPVRRAEKVVAQLHRHLPRIVGGLFAVTAWVDGELVGVGVASEPKAPRSRDGFTVEITRIATDGHPNACSRLYGALCRAAAAIGHRRAITFTQLFEPGISLRAAGFSERGVTRQQTWNRPRAPRSKKLSQVRRWVRVLKEPKVARLEARRVATAGKVRAA